MNQYQLLEKALKVAIMAHEGQIDKAGQPYIFHPLRVMNKCARFVDHLKKGFYLILIWVRWRIASEDPPIIRLIEPASTTNCFLSTSQ